MLRLCLVCSLHLIPGDMDGQDSEAIQTVWFSFLCKWSVCFVFVVDAWRDVVEWSYFFLCFFLSASSAIPKQWEGLNAPPTYISSTSSI